MKPLCLSFLLASASVLCSAGDTSALSGEWQIHNNFGGNESDQVCTFTQKDNDLTGSCNSEKGALNLTGKVSEKKVTWSYKSEYNGTPITVSYDGNVNSPAKIAGSVSVPELGAEGDFTASRSK